MSFAPNTPVYYQNQAYGKFANSQGYYQQPQQRAPQAAPQKAPTFRQGQAQSIQAPSHGRPWGRQSSAVTNMSQPMSRWSYR